MKHIKLMMLLMSLLAMLTIARLSNAEDLKLKNQVTLGCKSLSSLKQVSKAIEKYNDDRLLIRYYENEECFDAEKGLSYTILDTTHDKAFTKIRVYIKDEPIVLWVDSTLHKEGI